MVIGVQFRQNIYLYWIHDATYMYITTDALRSKLQNILSLATLVSLGQQQVLEMFHKMSHVACTMPTMLDVRFSNGGSI